ncbi:flagellar biosynthesis protein FlhF [Priestia flexa]|uniref:flagellar biosynthesis protein FlhF n=1 Tax=Priestia flexa TaxID=86664 RepID=UPI000C240AED|nr:flagellar biosynthesis protein FlhF [Priestia flexa]MEC0665161.1 flagellar biosynthesis protein FlhF [Priestia flexa]
MKVKKYVASSMPEAMKVIRAELGPEAVILKSRSVKVGGFMGVFTKKKLEVIAGVDDQVKKTKKYVKNRTDEQLMKQVDELKQLIATVHPLRNTVVEYPLLVQKVISYLQHQEIEERLLKEVRDKVMELYYTTPSLGDKQVVEWLKSWFEDYLSYSERSKVFQKKYISVVGPTGVGKTTTLAKLAASCILEQNKRVAFITTDTYRISAIDQLKTYASILNVPIEVCYNNEDFQQALQIFNEYDIVFIDTAGRNFLDSQYIHDLHNMMSFNEHMETFLVLAATAKMADLRKVYQQFSSIPIDSIILTKLDETTTFGPIINVLTECQLPASFMTIGQDVPDDLEKYTAEKIVDYLFGDWKHE